MPWSAWRRGWQRPATCAAPSSGTAHSSSPRRCNAVGRGRCGAIGPVLRFGAAGRGSVYGAAARPADDAADAAADARCDPMGPWRRGCGRSRCSAAPRPRALGRFVDTGWQDSRAVHDSRGPCSEKGPSLARFARYAFPDGALQRFSDAWCAYLAKASSFWIHGDDILPRRGAFPVRGPFGNA